jgi:anaerobic magnesium-protoporphyrin IX monomethyl ester cyclase
VHLINGDNRPVVLVYCPPSDPTQPYTSLPALTAHLRSHGFAVIQKDLSIEMLDTLLTRQRLASSFYQARQLAQRCSQAHSDKENGYAERFARMAGISDYVIENVEEAKRFLRSEDHFYDLKGYQRSHSVLELACDLVSLPYHPTRLSLQNYEWKAGLSTPDLLAATVRGSDNLFMEIFQKSVVPDILSLNPLLVGISVTYQSQIVPAFTLARLLKSTAPELHISIGGAVLHLMQTGLLSDPAFFVFADSFIVGEGETALRSLAENLRAGCALDSVPNAIIQSGGRPRASNLTWLEDVRQLACPDFDGLELERYLSPEPVLPLSSTRGCYHGKCTFCDVSRNTRSAYRPVGKDQLCKNIRSLRQKYGARRFFFCDDALAPSYMLEVSRLIREQLHDVTWGAEARFEKELTSDFLSVLKNGGCRKLVFGLESACQRVLDLMCKKNTVENDLQVLHACAANGIAVNTQTFIGFPTETREEALKTVDFLIANEQLISSFGFGVFDLFQNTAVYNDPERYRIGNIAMKNNRLLADLDFTALEGMTCAEAKQLYAESVKRLATVFGTRLYYFSDMHHLLFLSHYDYGSLNQKVAELDSAILNRETDLDRLILAVSPTILISPSNEAGSAPSYLLLCTESGRRFELSRMEKKLLDLFEKERQVGEAVSLWVGEDGKDLASQIKLMTAAFVTIKDLLKKRLLAPVPVCIQNSMIMSSGTARR